MFSAALCCSYCGCSHRYCSHGCSRSHRWSLLFASLLRALPSLGLGSFVLRLFEPLLCGASCHSRLFCCGVFLAGSWVVQNGPRMWRSLGGEESVRISSRNLPGVMLSCNEGDAGLAAEVREKMPHSRPVLNTFEHFVLGFHRGLRPVGLCLRVVPWSRFGASGLISCGLRLETFPGSRIRAQLGFLKKEKRKAKHKLRLDE